jgi:hypothetical protein
MGVVDQDHAVLNGCHLIAPTCCNVSVRVRVRVCMCACVYVIVCVCVCVCVRARVQGREAHDMANMLADEQGNVRLHAFGVGRGVDKQVQRNLFFFVVVGGAAAAH